MKRRQKYRKFEISPLEYFITTHLRLCIISIYIKKSIDCYDSKVMMIETRVFQNEISYDKCTVHIFKWTKHQKKKNNKKVQVTKEGLHHLTNVLRRQLIAPAMRISRDFQVKSWENASYMAWREKSYIYVMLKLTWLY